MLSGVWFRGESEAEEYGQFCQTPAGEMILKEQVTSALMREELLVPN